MARTQSRARFSACGNYRYWLTREFDSGVGVVNYLMLNPSTADAVVNDPTIARCERRAAAAGFQQLIVTNLFALRATDPRSLRTAPDPVGPENDQAILAAAQTAALVICAWGNHGSYLGRSAHVLALLRTAGVRPHALRITGAGEPGHPLYLPMAAHAAPMI